MKSGSLAAKELTDFFRESAKLEEENAKTHAKLAKQVRSSTVIRHPQGIYLHYIKQIYNIDAVNF